MDEREARTIRTKPTIGFGDRLRRLRLDLGMDQRQFAEAIGVDHATISRYETAARPPRAATHIAASIQLRFAEPGVDLRGWLLATGADAEPSGSRASRRVRVPAPRVATFRRAA
jgi:transcriptional regulator with XRE-family HTH domain